MVAASVKPHGQHRATGHATIDLTKRDLIKQAEALESEANEWPEDKYTECSHVREAIIESANQLRQRAQELTP